MDRGASTITRTHRNDNTLLRSCLYTHTFTPMHGRMSKPGDKTTYFQTRSRSTMLNFYHLNYPSCKIPSLASHTFLLPPPPPPIRMHCSSISAQPCLLSYHAQGLTEGWPQPKVLNRGHNLADKDCGMFGSVFPGLCTQNDLKKKKKKGSQGCILLLRSRGDIYEELPECNEMSCTDHSQK